MIQMIVSLYRAIIGVLFVVGLLFTFALGTQGGAGLVMGLGIILFMIMALGISAVLLSINDHLSAMRPTLDVPQSTEMRPTNWKLTGGIGVVALAAIVLASYLGSEKNAGAMQEAVTADAPLEANPANPDCVPELAAQVHLTC